MVVAPGEPFTTVPAAKAIERVDPVLLKTSNRLPVKFTFPNKSDSEPVKTNNFPESAEVTELEPVDPRVTTLIAADHDEGPAGP